MPLQKSNLNNNKIKNILKEQYNILAEEIIPIDKGTSNLYKIKAKDKNYILKEFQSKRNKETVEKEIGVINYLKLQNINIPTYLKTVNGLYYTENEQRVIILEEYIDGYTIEDNEANYKETIKSAEVLGKMVKQLNKYLKLSDENIIEEQFSKNALQVGIKKLEELEKEIKSDNIYKNKIIVDLDEKINISKELLNKFDFNFLDKITITNSHGDYCLQQLIYNKQNEVTVIDFEKTKSLPIIWEVMRSYSYISKKCKNGEIDIDELVEYVNEFNKYFKLNKFDLKYAPHIYLIQIVRSTFGYREFINDYNQEDLIHFAFFRTNLCRYLYNNLDEISLRLSRDIK